MGNVAAATQNPALSAILFLYREVLEIELPWLDNIVPARCPKRLSVVLTRVEARSVLDNMEGMYRLMASLLYGTGMRLMECVRLRVKDVDFDYKQIIIRDGKGQKDRVTLLPESLADALRSQIARAKALHEQDVAAGYGEVYLPHALEQKFFNRR